MVLFVVEGLLLVEEDFKEGEPARICLGLWTGEVRGGRVSGRGKARCFVEGGGGFGKQFKRKRRSKQESREEIGRAHV